MKYILLIAILITIIATSKTDPLCSESTRLKSQDYDRWVKSGSVDCKVYSNKLTRLKLNK